MRMLKDANGVVHLNYNKGRYRDYRETICEVDVWENLYYFYDDLTPCDNMLSCLMCIAHEKTV